MIFVRWSAERRNLPAAEVDGFFEEVTDQVSLFAFETNRMEVENHGGHLSLKMVASGEEVYHLNGRRIATPAAYARRVRVDRGLAELRRTASNRRAARAAGFASVGTFLRAARRTARR